MIKRVGVYALPQGADEDEFWECHTKVHAVRSLEAFGPHLERYTLNRVRRVHAGTGRWFGMAVTWWKSREDLDQAFAKLPNIVLSNGMKVSDDFAARTVDYAAAEVEEFTALDKLEAPGVKRMTFYKLADGIDGDEFFRYHTQKHSVDVLEAIQEDYCRQKYVINRVQQFTSGEECFYGFIETWWRTASDMERELSELAHKKLPDGQLVVAEFFDQVREPVVYEVEEYVALG